MNTPAAESLRRSIRCGVQSGKPRRNHIEAPCTYCAQNPQGDGSSSQKLTGGNRKVTISVSEPLIESLDDYAAKTGMNRSAAVEEALLFWYQRQQDRTDRDYYQNLTDRDHKTNEEWSRVTSEAAKHIWK